MHYLRSFTPWVIFAVLATEVDWRISALAGLAVAAALSIWTLATGGRLDSCVIELSGMAYFATVAVLAFVAPDSPVRDDVLAMSSAWLALTAWGSLAIGRPFTLGIARRMVDRELWDNPHFRRTNVVITAVWATSFTAEAIGVAVVTALAPHVLAPVIALRVAAFAVPVVFTIRYSALVQARAERAATAVTPDSLASQELWRS